MSRTLRDDEFVLNFLEISNAVGENRPEIEQFTLASKETGSCQIPRYTDNPTTPEQ